jgi:hypothetical protein
MVFSWLKRKKAVILTITEVKEWLDASATRNGILAETQSCVKALERLAAIAQKGVDEVAKGGDDGIERRAFVEAVRKLLQNPWERPDIHASGMWAEELSRRIEECLEETQRHAFVLREVGVWQEPVDSVIGALKGMDETVTGLRHALERQGYPAIEAVYGRIAGFEVMLARRSAIEKALVELRKDLEEPKSRIGRIEKRLEDLERTPGYASFKAIESDLARAEADVLRLEDATRPSVPPVLRPIVEKYRAMLLQEGARSEEVIQEATKSLQEQGMDEPTVATVREQLTMLDGRLQETRASMESTRQKAVDLKERLRKDQTRMIISEQHKLRSMLQEYVDSLEEDERKMIDQLERLSVRLSLQMIRDELRPIYPGEVEEVVDHARPA